MLDEDKRYLSQARMEHAEECLLAAKQLADLENYRTVANRSYYAIFHAMRAVLAYDGIDMKHHSGIISEFRRLYIKTGIFDTWMSNVISVLFSVRTDSDYDDFFVISKSDVLQQLSDAERFLHEIHIFLDKKQGGV